MIEHIYGDATELVGRTPLVRLNRIAKGLDAEIIGKLEYFNPGASVKDRIGLSMINDAEATGRLKPGGHIIEATSGNTGIALAWIGAIRGYKVTICMQDSLSVERRGILRALGAEVVLTEGHLGLGGAGEQAHRLLELEPDAFLPGQASNPANPQAHDETTAHEIWQDTAGKVDIFIATVGTGGTITGTGRVLRQYNPDVEIIGVEPAEVAILNGGEPGENRIQGIGGAMIPEVLDRELYNEIIDIAADDAFATSRQIARDEGLLVGMSAGAAVTAAIQVAKRPENKGKRIVVIIPDSGERYLSTELFADLLGD